MTLITSLKKSSTLVVKNKTLSKVFEYVDSLNEAGILPSNEDVVFSQTILMFNMANYIKMETDSYTNNTKHLDNLPRIVISHSRDNFGIFSIIMTLVDPKCIVFVEMPRISKELDNNYAYFLKENNLMDRIVESDNPVLNSYTPKSLDNLALSVCSENSEISCGENDAKIISQVSFSKEKIYIENIGYNYANYGLNFKPILNNNKFVNPKEITLMDSVFVKVHNRDYLPF